MRVPRSFVVLLALGAGNGLVMTPSPSSADAGEVLEFSGPGCLACQRMSPMVERLKRQGYPIRVLDIRRTPRLARQLDIKLLPTFVLIQDGKAVKKIVGVTSEAQLKGLAELARRKTVARTGGAAAVDGGDPGPSPAARFAEKFRQPTNDGTPVVRAQGQRDRRGASQDAGARSTTSENGLISSCVRLRLDQSDGHEYASGTIIDSRPGRSIILTCGHLFRSAQPRRARGSAVGGTRPGGGISPGGQLVVDVFGGRQPTSYAGRLLGFDLESDVGLVEISSPRVLPVARIGDVGQALSAGQRLISFGCNGGDDPTRELVSVTRLNRYLGPDNVECTGVPLQGRSGGGLLDAAGRVVGVCFAADPTYQRGLYAGLRPIHDLLARCHLTSLVRHRDQPGPGRDAVATASRTTRTAPTRRSLEDFSTPMRGDVLASTPSVPHRSTSGLSTGHKPVSSAGVVRSVEEIAEIQSALNAAEGAEVVCIIRSSREPRAASRIVIINRASRKFVADLLGEVDAQARPTSHRFLAPTGQRQPIPVNEVIEGGGFSIPLAK